MIDGRNAEYKMEKARKCKKTKKIKNRKKIETKNKRKISRSKTEQQKT